MCKQGGKKEEAFYIQNKFVITVIIKQRIHQRQFKESWIHSRTEAYQPGRWLCAIVHQDAKMQPSNVRYVLKALP